MTENKKPATITEQIVMNLSLEHAEVSSNILVLDNFMKTDKYQKLNVKEQRLMVIQYNAMQVYADTLLQRIDEIMGRMNQEV